MDPFVAALAPDTIKLLQDAGIGTAEELDTFSNAELKLYKLKDGDIARLRIAGKKRAREEATTADDKGKEPRKGNLKEAHRQDRIDAGLLEDKDNIQSLLPSKWAGRSISVQAFLLLMEGWKELPGGSNPHLWEELRHLVRVLSRIPIATPNVCGDAEFLVWSRMMILYLKMRLPRHASKVVPEWEEKWLEEVEDTRLSATQYRVVCSTASSLEKMKTTETEKIGENSEGNKQPYRFSLSRNRGRPNFFRPQPQRFQPPKANNNYKNKM